MAQAAAHANAAILYHKNEFKVMHARSALALALVHGGSPPQASTKTSTKSTVPAVSREIVFPQNAKLELLHQKLLNATNEGNIELFKSMITDDIISVDPMGKSLSGRAAVEEAMVLGLQMVKGNFDVEEGENSKVKCELKTAGEGETCARYTVSMMGMVMVLGGRIKWQGEKVRSTKSVMNPTGWDF